MYMGLVVLGRQEKRTAQTLEPERSSFEVEMVTEKLKIRKSPGIYQIPAEMIRAGGKQFPVRSINLLILFGIRRNCPKSGRSRSLYLSVRRTIKHTAVIIGAYQFCQLRTKFYPTFCCQG
jgi:hypothetical protein